MDERSDDRAPLEPRAKRYRARALTAAASLSLLLLGALLTPVGQKIVDLVWPDPDAKPFVIPTESALPAGQGCRAGGPPLAVSFDYDFTGSTWWATKDPLPADAADRLNGHENFLSTYAPVQSEYESGSLLKLVVTGCGPKSVVFTDATAVVHKRSDPLGGSLVFVPPQGNLTVTSIGFDLDAANPEARQYDAKAQTLGEPYFVANAVQVAPGEAVPFLIMGLTKKSYVEWSVNFDTLVDGNSWKFNVSLTDGDPIQSTSLATSYKNAFWLNISSFRWEAIDPVRLRADWRLV